MNSLVIPAAVNTKTAGGKNATAGATAAADAAAGKGFWQCLDGSLSGEGAAAGEQQETTNPGEALSLLAALVPGLTLQPLQALPQAEPTPSGPDRKAWLGEIFTAARTQPQTASLATWLQQWAEEPSKQAFLQQLQGLLQKTAPLEAPPGALQEALATAVQNLAVQASAAPAEAATAQPAVAAAAGTPVAAAAPQPAPSRKTQVPQAATAAVTAAGKEPAETPQAQAPPQPQEASAPTANYGAQRTKAGATLAGAAAQAVPAAAENPRPQEQEAPAPVPAAALWDSSRLRSAAARETQAATTAAVADPHGIFDQLVAQARLIRLPGATEMVIRLKPEHLGELVLKVAVDAAGTVNTTFHSNQPEVRAVLEANLQQFRQEMQQQGLRIQEASVYAGLGDALPQRQGGQQERQPQGQDKPVLAEETSLEAVEFSLPGDSAVDYRV